ncbi:MULTISPECIES: polysaccharide deacetylase family protein [unclassified Uliginosibacterium]|uniref:polysaccharide deacetylase family protein n=1 Tax=unclassified Uliginosibacterium TaxID=2621521 RepID=UPI000C7B2021|nr:MULTISPECIES: polysaccharide deacetylase family protein [unclassified Uliginosibacterium]MDO6387575.1 polysaccharide deacetylase family protein [Uliginosibacterium sp. 31-12]PLK47898.1 polysaccharide deacetylase family protein [Uliginosibacterium sp. TH139]
MKLSPFMRFSLGLHGALAVALLLRPDWWPVLLAIFVLDHLVLGLAGMWPQSTLLGANITRLPAHAAARREVAITIDDGPDPAVTPQVLAILAAHGAVASFFCIGERAARHPELVRAMVAAGHAVENHGMHHRNHLAFSGFGGWRREVGSAQFTLSELAGTPPRFYRALAGLRNPFLDPVLQALGLHLATWSRRGFDTRCSDPAEVLARLCKGLEPGAILLLHDGHAARDAAGQPIILGVLPRLLEALAARGLTPVTLRSCLP